MPNSSGSDWDLEFFLKYIIDMSAKAQWGGQEELAALSRAFGVRCINVNQISNRQTNMHRDEGEVNELDSPFCVTVLFDGVNHYDTIKFEKP